MNTDPNRTFAAQVSRRITIGLYLLLLLLHIAHVFEEIWGRFIMIQFLVSLGGFLIINWLIFAVVLLIFYFYLAGKRWSMYGGIFYAAVMTVNGLGHLAGTLLTGQYFSGFAGAVSGCAYIIVGPVLVYRLTIELRHSKPIGYREKSELL